VVSVPEAPLRETRYGLAPDGDGWFVVNARDSRWRESPPFASWADFEGKKRFPQLGFSLYVLYAGQPMSLYHRERHQENFLVLSGECVLIVEGEERKLGPWDFFHCPGGTAHTIVGAGDAPSLVVGVGARGGPRGYVYDPDATAAAYDAAVVEETTDAGEAYARFPPGMRSRARDEWFGRGGS
jgi:mannose-6-phosphate isomerase-like protein (cupin superfamily)